MDYLKKYNMKQLIEMFSNGEMLRKIEDEKVMEECLKFINTLDYDKELQFRILNAKTNDDKDENTNFLHVINGTKLINIVFNTLNNKEMIARLLKEKDSCGHDVFDRCMRLGMHRSGHKDAQKWVILREYHDSILQQ